MSFQLNNEQQMAINDALLSLTERETKYLKNSRAETFVGFPLCVSLYCSLLPSAALIPMEN